MPARHEGAEALARRAPQVDVDGAVGQAPAAAAPGHLGAEHRADGAIDVADGALDVHRLAPGQRRRRRLDERHVEGPLEAVVLRHRVVQRLAVAVLGRGEDRRQVEAVGLPVVDGGAGVEHLDVADRLLQRAEPERRQQLAHLLGDELEEVDDELGLAREALAQHRVLGGHADRAGVEVADPHHHAARHDERGGGEAELLGAEQGGDHHVAPGLHLPVGLHHDAVPQAVEEQRLLRLGQAQLPRRAGVLQRRERRRPGAAVVARDEHDVGVGLRHAGRHRADADLGHQLHVDAGARVGVLQVVDELLQILDGVDVVVGRRRDQADTGRRVPGAGDPRVHLVARQLAALARLGALGHLDLQVVGVHQVLAGDAEATRRHLLDGRAAQVAVVVGHVAIGVLAALAGVALAADAVHGDGEGLVGLLGDRAVAHGAGGEARHDRAGRLDLVDRHRWAGAGPQLEQAPQRGQVLGLLVDQAGVVLEDVVAAGAGGVLQLEHRLRVEQVVLALAAPLVLAAQLELAVGPLLGTGRVGDGVAGGHLGGDLVEADATETAHGAGEVLVDEVLAEADGLEHLGAGVGRHRRDAHLRHDLQHALAGGLDVAVHGVVGRRARRGR